MNRSEDRIADRLRQLYAFLIVRGQISEEQPKISMVPADQEYNDCPAIDGKKSKGYFN